MTIRLLTLFGSLLSMASTIGFRIARLPHLWRSILDRRLAPLGLTQTRWVTLYHLWKLGEGNPQCDLARAIGVEAPSLVRTLGQLEEQGVSRAARLRQRPVAASVSISPQRQCRY